MILPLPWQNIPIIKTGGIALQMPLADHAGVITGGLQHFGNGRLAAVETIEDSDAVDMAVFSGENRRAARGADGIDDETILEAHAFVGDAVDVRRLVDLAAVSAD